MRIAIVEDDKNDIGWLKNMFTEYEQGAAYSLSVEYYTSGKLLLEHLTYEKYDFILMDIYMDEMDGIETANCIQKIDDNVMIAFLTTSEEDIWRAVNTHNCFDYMQKQSFNLHRLQQLLQDVYKRLKIQDEFLVFYNGKQKIQLKSKEIQYILANDKYTAFHLKGQIYKYRITFSKIYELLEGREEFVLCNRGILLHMDFILRTDGDTFLMTDKTKHPIRRRGRKEIIDRFHDYQFKKLENQEFFS